jgi:hypothetical protein
MAPATADRDHSSSGQYQPHGKAAQGQAIRLSNRLPAKSLPENQTEKGKVAGCDRKNKTTLPPLFQHPATPADPPREQRATLAIHACR